MGKVTAFILSHNRSSSCPTLDLLNKLNYSGDYKIVIDDEDKELELYKEKYGEHLLIFHKEDYMYVDTGYATEHTPKGTPLYAREFITTYAYNNNVGDFLMLDDDICRFKIRVPNWEEGTLTSCSIRDINILLDYLFEFMNKGNIYCLSPCHNGDFIGGLDSFNEEKLLNKRMACIFFLFNSQKKFNWYSIWNEDYNSSLYNGKIGQLVFKIPQLNYETEKLESHTDSGMGDFYKSTPRFNRAFYRVVLFPSTSVVREYKKEGNFIPYTKIDNQLPKIISGRFKK